jgi:hypothetical protein
VVHAQIYTYPSPTIFLQGLKMELWREIFACFYHVCSSGLRIRPRVRAKYVIEQNDACTIWANA